MQVDAASGLLAVAHGQAELRVYQFCPREREIAVAVLGTTPGLPLLPLLNRGMQHAANACQQSGCLS